ncbi:MAG: hypothetical protein C5B54_08255, partial [Acidobacteria bacterium]
MKVTASKSIPHRPEVTAAIDLPFFMPRRPRFLQELVVVPFKDELIIEGTERPQTINAPLPDSIVPDLMRLMNGKRTFDELLAALPGASAEDLLETISSLYRWGLVEDAAADPELEFSNVETLAFLRRYVGVTRSNRSGGEAYDRLRESEVLVFDSDDALDGAARLQALLAKVGVGRVVPLRRMLPPRLSLSVAQSMAVSVSLRGEDCEWHRKLDDWCFERRLPWLRIVVSPDENCADFGPLFDGERTPCFRCFQQVHSITGGSGRALAENRLGIEAHFWMGMAAAEITYCLTRICPLATERAIERYDLNQQTSRRLHLLRVPGCLRCRPPARLQGTGDRAENIIGEMDSAAVFEEYVALSSRPRIPFTVQQDYALISSALAKQAKRMPNCTHVPLRRTLSGLERPALEIFHESVVGQRHAITVDELSTVLMTTAGLRDVEPGAQQVQRWSATAGNLGSVELFLVVRHVEGLAPGLYFYESSQHRLAFFQQRGSE